MPWTDAFIPAEQEYKRQVMESTWGHLAPKKNKVYKGYVVFAIGCFGSDYLNPTVLEAEFGDLDASPWWFNALQELLGSLKTEVGRVYRYDGTFRNYEFTGSYRRLVLSPSVDFQNRPIFTEVNPIG